MYFEGTNKFTNLSPPQVASWFPILFQQISQISALFSWSAMEIGFLQRTEQTATFPFESPDAKIPRSLGFQDTLSTSWSWLLKTLSSRSMWRVSNSLTVLSLPHVRSHYPHSENLTFEIEFMWEYRLHNSSRSRGSHNFKILSLLPEAINAINGCQSQVVMSEPCP